MNEPGGDWQFWWNWWIQAAVAAGTVLAVVVALFGPWLRYVLQPPKLKIALKNSAGERAAIGIRAPDGAIRPAFARYYHIRVWNERRFSQATDVALWHYRERRWQTAQQAAPDGCPVKGNINHKGERIYHAPWSPWYERTRVNPKNGERWFCNEKEALDAGWRAPLWGR